MDAIKNTSEELPESSDDEFGEIVEFSMSDLEDSKGPPTQLNMNSVPAGITDGAKKRKVCAKCPIFFLAKNQ